jgi:LPXTG-site transpeptidase (sortase) family protein
MNRFIRPALNVLIVGGVVIAAWPVGQTIYGKWSQRNLAAQWQTQMQGAKKGFTKPQKLHGKASNPPLGALPDPDATGNDIFLTGTPKQRASWPLTKFSAPDISLETYVVEGIDSSSLRRGPGHFPGSALPGSGNCVIAGHRNIYGSFFYHLDELLPGSPIVLENRQGKWTYRVNTVYMTPDTDLTVMDQPTKRTPPELTIITCTLPHTNNRIIIHADLSD